MPLKGGKSQKVISENIHELTHHGSRPRSHAQIVAIALHNADKYSAGGLADAAGYAKGGVFGSLNFRPPHGLARATGPTGGLPKVKAPLVKGGFLHSTIPGRTDRLATRVKSGSHIIPADVVSSLGQGNSLAGARHLDMTMRALPTAGFARGGSPSASHRSPPHHRPESHEPVLLAGGEYVIDPHEVVAIGGGDAKRGHDILDRMIVRVRRKEAKKMLKLPGPKK